MNFSSYRLMCMCGAVGRRHQRVAIPHFDPILAAGQVRQLAIQIEVTRRTSGTPLPTPTCGPTMPRPGADLERRQLAPRLGFLRLEARDEVDEARASSRGSARGRRGESRLSIDDQLPIVGELLLSRRTADTTSPASRATPSACGNSPRRK